MLFAPDEVPEPMAAPSEQALQEELEEQEKQLTQLRTQLQKLPEEARLLLEMKHQGGKTCECDLSHG